MTSLLGCQAINNLPAFPHPPPEVGKEINPRCFPRDPDTDKVLNNCPVTKDWIAQLMKYEAETGVK